MERPTEPALGQPGAAVDGRHAVALGAGVVLQQDGAPPVDHLLLDLDRARRGGVDGDPQAGDVVLVAGGLRQLQHPDEHRRHELRVRDAPVTDGLQGLLGVESLHHRDGAAERLDGTAPAQRRRVVDRAGRQVDRVLIDAEELAGQGHQGLAGLGHLDAGQRRPDSLGPAGGTRGVQHGGAVRLIGGRHRGRRGDGLLIAAVARDRTAEGQPQLHPGGQAGDGLGGGGQFGRHDQRGRAAVADDVGHLIRLEAVVDGGDVQTGSQRGPVHLEGAQVVLRQQRYDVAGPQAHVVEHVRQLDRAPLEFSVAERLAGAGHDRRDPVRRLGCVSAWVHGPPPGREACSRDG